MPARGRVLAAALLLLSMHPASASPTADAAACREAAAQAEKQGGLPAGLLHAVGRIETGRFDPATGSTEPWPWSTNLDGTGHYFATKDEAIAWTAARLSAGQGSIDVGCFQINLKYHPSAFATLDEAFDPAANARYAAAFLADLYRRSGGWQIAAANYHSHDPILGTPYGLRVFALMDGAETALAGPAVEAIGIGRAVRIALIRPAIQVVVPSWASAPSRSAAQAIPVGFAVSMQAVRIGPMRRSSQLPKVYRPF